jgi:hypothetical protein
VRSVVVATGTRCRPARSAVIRRQLPQKVRIWRLPRSANAATAVAADV